VITRKEIATLTGHHDIVRSVAFSPDGQMLATGSWDGTAKLWDVAAGKELATLTGHRGAVKAVAFAPDGETLATGSVDNTIKLWDVARRAERATLTGHSAAVLSLIFNADGKTLASGSEDGSIRLWELDPRSPSPYRPLFDPPPPFGERGVLRAGSKVWTVAFAPGDHLLASGQENGTVMIWDLKFKNERRPKHPEERVYKATRKDGRIVSWFVRTMRAAGRVYSAAFSPDGRKLVTGGSPGGFVVYGGEFPRSGPGPVKPAVQPLMWWNIEPSRSH
jgi:WD40 repeat protein